MDWIGGFQRMAEANWRQRCAQGQGVWNEARQPVPTVGGWQAGARCKEERSVRGVQEVRGV
jgi:hypothetical protein